MSNEPRNHETRISRIEGIIESLATKEDLAKLETRLNNTIDQKINEQTKLFRSEMSEMRQEIRKLNEKQHRIIGAGELIKFVIPLIASFGALFIAVFQNFLA